MTKLGGTSVRQNSPDKPLASADNRWESLVSADDGFLSAEQR